MAAIFNGTSSDLSISGESTPDYPVLFGCWFAPANVTHNGSLVGLSNDGSGGLQSLVLSARGDQPGDPLWATATAGGASSSAASASAFLGMTVQGGVEIWRWNFVAALFTSASSRKVFFKGSWSAEETTTRTITNLTHVSIGSLWNGGAGTVFNGRLAEAGIWSAVDLNHVDLAVEQLEIGLQPDQIWHIRDSLYIYQRLRAAANESDSVGPTMTASNLTFVTDLPFVARIDPDYTSENLDDLEQAAFRWPDSGSTPGKLPANRIVTLDASERIQLAAADSDKWVGCTRGAGIGCANQFVTLRGAGRLLLVEMASGASFTPGESIVYLAADGKVDDSGASAIGIASHVAQTLVHVIPY